MLSEFRLRHPSLLGLEQGKAMLLVSVALRWPRLVLLAPAHPLMSQGLHAHGGRGGVLCAALLGHLNLASVWF